MTGWRKAAWLGREVLAYALPSIIVIALCWEIMATAELVRKGQEEALGILKDIARGRDEDRRWKREVEHELASAKLRMVSLEMQLDEANRKANP